MGRWLNQILGGDTQLFVQLPNHGQGQGSLAIQDFVDPVAAADYGLQVFRRKASLLHSEFDGLDVTFPAPDGRIAFSSF